MKYKTPSIFPTLAGAWGEVNLNTLAIRDFSKVSPNPLVNPYFAQEWVNKIAQELQADFTFGGYLEDRKNLWRGHYQDQDKSVHFGVDFNVPAQVPVASPVDGQVIYTKCDMDQFGGWGGFVVIKINDYNHLIFGHLAHNSLPTTGSWLKQGDVFARTGEIEENGGWFEHLHVQCFDALIQGYPFSEFNQHLITNSFLYLDGYGATNTATHINNPLKYIKMEN